MKSCNHYSILRDKPSILQILAEYGYYPTKRNGKYWMKCLFHMDKTPSMCIYPEQERFHCFGCGRSGDSLDLFSALSGRPLREVLRDFSIELPSPSAVQKQREQVKILRKFEAECMSCWKRLTFLLRETYRTERELQKPTSENLERLADIYFLREIIEQLLSKLEDSDIKVRLNAINEARTRGLC